MNSEKPGSKSDNLIPGSGSKCLHSDLQVLPSNPTDCQDSVHPVDAIPSAKEQPRSTSTMSISNAPPNVSEVVNHVRTRVGRLVRPEYKLIYEYKRSQRCYEVPFILRGLRYMVLVIRI